jgi:hypothetical protein
MLSENEGDGTVSIDPKSKHYDVGGIEALDIIKAKLTTEQYKGFLLGSIFKYACRMYHIEDPTRDAEKIKTYALLLLTQEKNDEQS